MRIVIKFYFTVACVIWAGDGFLKPCGVDMIGRGRIVCIWYIWLGVIIAWGRLCWKFGDDGTTFKKSEIIREIESRNVRFT